MAVVPFITGATVGTLRSDYSGDVGFRVRIGANPVTVTALGRWVVAGNAGTHTLVLTTWAGTAVASASLDTAGKTAGAFAYVDLAAPVTLDAATDYAVGSGETSGGDQWYGDDTTVTSTAVAEVIQAAHRDAGTTPWLSAANGLRSFGPASFLYDDGSASPISVALNSLSLSLTPQAVAPSPSPAAPALASLPMALAPQALAPSPAASTVALASLPLALTAQALQAVPSPASVGLTSLSLSLLAQALGVATATVRLPAPAGASVRLVRPSATSTVTAPSGRSS